MRLFATSRTHDGGNSYPSQLLHIKTKPSPQQMYSQHAERAWGRLYDLGEHAFAASPDAEKCCTPTWKPIDVGKATNFTAATFKPRTQRKRGPTYSTSVSQGCRGLTLKTDVKDLLLPLI